MCVVVDNVFDSELSITALSKHVILYVLCLLEHALG